MDYTIKIGGEAGQGIQTIGDTLAKVFSRSGYHVFTHQDYESRVRGGHNFYQVRFSEREIMASRDGVDILIALDRESIDLHGKEVSEGGHVIHDSSSIGPVEGSSVSGTLLDIPFVALAEQHGGSKIMANTVATGAVLGMLGMKADVLTEIVRDTFKKKGETVIEANIRAVAAGRDFAVKECLKCAFVPADPGAPKLLISGTEAVGLGAIASGCRFYSAYPMTPSTGVMNYIADHEKEYGIVVEQAEDEISAINMALGASFAGVRAMTGTSGGGLALMVEGISLAGITETPVVIALGQRPGPATGFPTRTEQGELQFVIYTAHGEFPRIVFAPGSPEQALLLTNKAFDLAEKYQVPAFVIFDQYLADTTWTYDKLDMERLKVHDYRLRGDALGALQEYKRHGYTESGVTPLGVPGASRHLIVTDSDEHDEEGHIVEDAETRIRMTDKRIFRKLPLIRDEISPPLVYGDPSPDVLLAGWGSMFGLMKEAVDVLSKKKIAMLHFSEVYPFPPPGKQDFLSLLGKAKTAVCIEQNATGQFARLMRAETGFVFGKQISRYDGRPFTLEGIVQEIGKAVA